MLAADYIIDIWDHLPVHGGEVVAQGTPKDFKIKYYHRKIFIE